MGESEENVIEKRQILERAMKEAGETLRILGLRRC